MKRYTLGKTVALVVLVVLVATLGDAQKKAPQTQKTPRTPTSGTPTFSVKTEFVLVPAIVTDKNGHVSGLTKDDFILKEDGVEQKIASVEEVKPNTNPIHRVSGAAKREYSNMNLTDQAPRTINIIVLDTINTGILDLNQAKKDLVKFLTESMTDNNQLTTLLLMTRGGVQLIHDFTADPQVLIRALQTAKTAKSEMMNGVDSSAIIDPSNPTNDATSDPSSDASSSEPDINSIFAQAESNAAQQQQENAIDATLDGFEAIANAYAGIPGRKALIWLSGGFPMRLNQPGDMVGSSFEARYDNFFEKINNANISLYPVDARRLVVTSITAAESTSGLGTNSRGGKITSHAMNPNQAAGRSEANQKNIDTLRTLADMTGGRAYFNTNDLQRAISSASGDSSHYYLLGYYVKSDPSKDGWHKISVKTRRGGTQVRARSGYLLSSKQESDPETQRKHDITEALNSPLEFTVLPITAHILGQRPNEQDKSKIDIVFELLVPGSRLDFDVNNQNKMDLMFVAAAWDSASKLAGAADQQMQGNLTPETLEKVKKTGFQYHNQISVPSAGEYSLKFVVRDNNSGRIGSVSAPVVRVQAITEAHAEAK